MQQWQNTLLKKRTNKRSNYFCTAATDGLTKFTSTAAPVLVHEYDDTLDEHCEIFKWFNGGEEAAQHLTGIFFLGITYGRILLQCYALY